MGGAFDELLPPLGALGGRLGRGWFRVGDDPTGADLRMYPALARFDAVYYLHYKCNLRRLVDYPYMWGYARDLFQRPGFGDTTDFGQIKRHYYQSQDWINPSRLVPKGPFVTWLAPPRRARLSGRAQVPVYGRRRAFGPVASALGTDTAARF